MKKRPNITKRDIVWNCSENATLTHSATHGLYEDDDKEQYHPHSGKTDFGNSALCNRSYGIGDGDNYLPIVEVDANSTYECACKRCQKIYDKLPD